jgi:hypothetical protein
MSAQQAVFTASGNLQVPVDHLMDKARWEPLQRFDGRAISSTDMYDFYNGLPWHVIHKIKLPQEWRREALRTLRLMGITADSLFPGLDGIGDATTLHIEGLVPSLGEILG